MRSSALLTLLIFFAIFGWQAWNSYEAPYRMTPALRSALAAQTSVDILVRVNFKLESFHLNYFQDQGRVARVEDRQVLLKAVPTKKVRAMARNYWISRISLAEETISHSDGLPP